MYSSGINSNAKRKQTDELTNTIVIKFEKDIDYGNILRKTIHDAIVEQLNVPKFSFEKICFPRSKYFWIIVFKHEFDAKNIIGKWIDFNGKKVKIEDYNRSIIFTYSYKIIWIDEKEDPMNIRRLVLEKLGVKEGTDEKTQVKVSKFIEEGYIDHDSVSEKCDGILYKTGNITMTIKCNKNIPIKEIKGIHRHEGKNIRIIQYDNVKKCFGCGDEGHLRASCPDAEKYCEKCKKKDMLRKNVDPHHMLRKLVQLIQAMIYTKMTFIMKMGREKKMGKKMEVEMKSLMKVVNLRKMETRSPKKMNKIQMKNNQKIIILIKV
jgi:hypothetical protein